MNKNTETKAKERVANTPELEKFSDVIFYDWPNWDEHMEWIATATVTDIVKWAEGVKRDEQ